MEFSSSIASVNLFFDVIDFDEVVFIRKSFNLLTNHCKNTVSVETFDHRNEKFTGINKMKAKQNEKRKHSCNGKRNTRRRKTSINIGELDCLIMLKWYVLGCDCFSNWIVSQMKPNSCATKHQYI